MRFTITVTLTKKWLIQFLRGVFICLIVGCIVDWKVLRLILATHDMALVDAFLSKVLPVALGVSIGVTWPIKFAFQRSQEDNDTGQSSYIQNLGFRFGKALRGNR
jgi:hypothetical protein